MCHAIKANYSMSTLRTREESQEGGMLAYLESAKSGQHICRIVTDDGDHGYVDLHKLGDRLLQNIKQRTCRRPFL